MVELVMMLDRGHWRLLVMNAAVSAVATVLCCRCSRADRIPGSRRRHAAEVRVVVQGVGCCSDCSGGNEARTSGRSRRPVVELLLLVLMRLQRTFDVIV